MDLSTGVRGALQGLAAAVLLVVAFEVLYLVPAAAIAKVGSFGTLPVMFIAGLMGLAAFIVAWLALRFTPRPVAAALTNDVAASRRFAILLPLGVGLLLRALLIAFTDITPQSDAKVYTQMAAMLADGQPFYFAHRWAYWPVGYPFLLSLWARMGGASMAGLHVLNLLLFVAMFAGIARLARAIAMPAAGRMALWLLALWPDLLALSAWPSKELVAMALLPWTLALVLEPHRNAGTTLLARIAGGVCGGLLVLVQPSFILLVPVLSIIAWLTNRQTGRQALLAAAVLIVTAAATIAPWTLRNYRVLGAFVPVATNGGEVLYRANNPLATGEYIKVGEIDLWPLPELEAHRQGMQLAKQWIAAHPREFLVLAGKKQAFFLEDDAIGVYEVFNRGRTGGPIEGWKYFVLKAICSAWWWTMWAALGAALVIVWRRGAANLAPAVAIALPFVYLYLIHSIFESGPRYHQPGDPFVALTVAILLATALRSDSSRTAEQTG